MRGLSSSARAGQPQCTCSAGLCSALGEKTLGKMEESNGVIRALACASKGWLVFPCGEDKRPLIKWGEGATNVELDIRRLWRQFPDALVGVVTGQRSGLYVVDVDDPERLAELELDLSFGRQVPTRRAGGMHHYFAGPTDGKPVRNVGGDDSRPNRPRGVDFRGDGGMVVCWLDPAEISTLNPLPLSVVEWARDGKKEGQPAGEVPEEIVGGTRQTTMTSLAGSMRRRGMTEQEILESLRIVNANRCRPPMDDAELQSIAHSIAQKEPAAVPRDLTNLIDQLRSKRSAADAPERKSRLLSAQERRDKPPMEWAVEKLIPEWGIGQMFGDTATGKTFVAIDLAMRMCNDNKLWLNATINHRGPVIYALMEGAFDFQQRIDAWIAAHPGSSDEDLWVLEEEALDLASVESVVALVEDIRLLDLVPAMVIIDTQALATPGTNESDNSEMGVVMSHLKALATDLHCPVMTVHHTGLQNKERSRGASAQKAALDFEIQVTPSRITYTKLKAAPIPDPWYFKLEPAGDSMWAGRGNIVHGANARRDSIKKVLKDQPWEYTKTDVAQKAVGNYDAVRDEVDAMVESRTILKKGAKLALAEDVEEA